MKLALICRQNREFAPNLGILDLLPANWRRFCANFFQYHKVFRFCSHCTRIANASFSSSLQAFANSFVTILSATGESPTLSTSQSAGDLICSFLSCSTIIGFLSAWQRFCFCNGNGLMCYRHIPAICTNRI